MILRHILLAAGCLTSASAFAVAGPSAPTLEMSADGEIQIAVDGHVSDYRLQSKLAPVVASLVDHDVRGWTFEPVVVDGVAVVAKTAMHLDLKAEPDGAKDHYKIRIVNVTFGAPRRSENDQTRPPHYPEAAVSGHVGAKVLLYVRLDDSGRIVDAQPCQTSLDKRTSSENEAERWRKLFEKASIAAAKGWRYDLSEAINGKPIGTIAVIPVVYNVAEFGARKPESGEWKAYVAGPVHPAPWSKIEGVADNRGLSTLQDGQALSLESRFRLKDDVIGKTL
jgi:hypothetical protein